MSDSLSLVLRALNPTRSVVVEACAGSGKTWLLASRIVRLLLGGVAPGEILAITFTRKAAREIEERVVDWLHFLATGDETQVAGFLAERGVVADSLLVRSARGLYERVLAAQPGLAVSTFHGWFLQLVDAAPLSANLAVRRSSIPTRACSMNSGSPSRPICRRRQTLTLRSPSSACSATSGSIRRGN